MNRGKVGRQKFPVISNDKKAKVPEVATYPRKLLCSRAQRNSFSDYETRFCINLANSAHDRQTTPV